MKDRRTNTTHHSKEILKKNEIQRKRTRKENKKEKKVKQRKIRERDRS